MESLTIPSDGGMVQTNQDISLFKSYSNGCSKSFKIILEIGSQPLQIVQWLHNDKFNTTLYQLCDLAALTEGTKINISFTGFPCRVDFQHFHSFFSSDHNKLCLEYRFESYKNMFSKN